MGEWGLGHTFRKAAESKDKIMSYNESTAGHPVPENPAKFSPYKRRDEVNIHK